MNRKERLEALEKSMDGDTRDFTIGRCDGKGFFIMSSDGSFLHPRPRFKTYALCRGNFGAAVFKREMAEKLLIAVGKECEKHGLKIVAVSDVTSGAN